MSFVASFTLLYLAPLCFSGLSLFCFFFGGHTHDDTQDVIVHVSFLRAGSDPTSLCLVWFGLVVVVCFWFALFAFVSGCVFVWFLDGIAHWTVYWSITSAFEAIDGVDGLA